MVAVIIWYLKVISLPRNRTLKAQVSPSLKHKPWSSLKIWTIPSAAPSSASSSKLRWASWISYDSQYNIFVSWIRKVLILMSLTQSSLLSGVYPSHHRSEEVHSPLSSPARRRRSSQWPTSSPSTLASSLSLADHVFPMRMMVVSTSNNSQLGLFCHCSVIHPSFTNLCSPLFHLRFC